MTEMSTFLNFMGRGMEHKLITEAADVNGKDDETNLLLFVLYFQLANAPSENFTEVAHASLHPLPRSRDQWSMRM